ncbi:DUF4145 domain-containing protein [Pseudomonas sp. R2.Fl]|nr:DUF4145 domain-containing protein [Pseudomonas sp. R2.Fl]
MLEFKNPLAGLDRCPQCNVAKPLLDLKWSETTITSHGFGIHWEAYECSSCNKITLAEGLEAPTDEYGRIRRNGPGVVIRVIYPSVKKVDENLPEDAQRYLKQAMETSFAPDASIVMAASAVDAMLKGKSYKEGSLYARIDKAVSDHVLTEGMAQWAHKVRLEANAVRHADEEARVPTADDARKVVEFASALGDFLYVFTARVTEGIKEATPSGAK